MPARRSWLALRTNVPCRAAPHLPPLPPTPSALVVCPAAGREAVPVRYSAAFVEALLSMLGALVTSTSGESRPPAPAAARWQPAVRLALIRSFCSV
jgi:hypothetical protein